MSGVRVLPSPACTRVSKVGAPRQGEGDLGYHNIGRAIWSPMILNESRAAQLDLQLKYHY
jgi:hypothetical protein